MAVGAATAAVVTSDAAPTSQPVVDAAWRALPILLLVLAGARATRLSWVWLAGVASVAAVGSWAATIAAVAALFLAAASAWAPTRPRVVGAVVCGLAGCALLSLPDLGRHGTELAVAAVAVVPVLHRGYLNGSHRERRMVRRALVGASAGLVIAGVAVAIAVGLASSALRDGVADARAGVALVSQGDQEAGADRFAAGNDSFDRADRLLSGPWTWPARLVPVVAQNVEASATAAASGADLTKAAGGIAETAPYQDLKARSGAVDLGVLHRMQEPLAQAETTLADADAAVVDAGSPWLVPPVADALDRLDAEVADVLPDTRLARQAVDVLPGMLGGEGERRYLVWFTTPAETRNLGGFIGAYGVLAAEGGRLDLVESGGIADLMDQSDWRTRRLEGHDEFLTRYGRYQPARFLQNLSASPDMGTTADVSAELFEQVTGTTVDGVMVVDPHAIAALLELTGPVDLEGRDRPLTTTDAADYLLREQYELFEGDDTLRQDRLIDAGRATFDALTERSLPAPATLGRVLGPVVERKHLAFFPFASDARALVDDLGALGRFEVPARSDFISLRSANLRANKIDSFLHRRLDYRATYDPTTGRVEALATVVLRNEAPASGLPDYIIGPADSRHPLGTNRMYASVFTPLVAEAATLDGRPVGLESQSELGANVFTAVVAVPPGGTATLEVRLRGHIEGMGDEYRLTVSSQPLANPDRLSVEVVPVPGAPPVESVVGFPTATLRHERRGDTDSRYAVAFSST